MTIINPNSISGISSITALNSTAAINLFKADGTSANIIAGVVTATSLDISGDIDVDGHTELDNVKISGIASVHNTLRFTHTGGGHIDHGAVDHNLNFRVSKSSTADTTMMQINASSENTKFRKYVTVGLQGGDDTAVLGGGSGIGAYLQLNYASNSIVNTKLLGNGNSWLNSNYGNLGIGTAVAGKKLHVFGSNSHPVILERGDNANTQIELKTAAATRGYWGASDTANFMVYDNDASDVNFTVLQTGQIGIGNIVPDTWSTGHGLTIGTSQATLWGVGDQVNLSGNAYFNSGWKAAATKAGASQIQQALGNIDFRVTGSINADAAITWTEAVRITPAGVIGINDTNPGTGKKVKVVVDNNSSYQMAVNLTNNVNADINFYIKTNESLIAPSTNTPLCLGTGGVERLRIKSNGHTGIGTDDPLNRLHVRIQRGNSTGLTASAALDSGNNLYLPATRLENSGMSGNIEVGQLFLAGSTDQAQWLISCKKTGSNVGDFIFRTRTAATTSAEKLRIASDGGITQTSTEAFQIAKGTTAQRPSSPVVGMVRFNTTTNALENYNSTGWTNVNVKIPAITSISGNIYNGFSTNLTINGNDFDATVTVTFKEGATTRGTLTNQSVSSGSLTVAVPSGVYGQSAGDTITITITNSDGTISGGVNKTIQTSPSGGTITTSGNYRIHSFTSSGNFVNTVASLGVEYLVIAGGGAGGSAGNSVAGGGGGAGGYRSNVSGQSSGGGNSAESSMSLSAATFAVVVGAGAAATPGTSDQGGVRGSNSSFNSITSTGGGGGGGNGADSSQASGGSGGGGKESNGNGGSGTSGQGYDGGDGSETGNAGGGGGGAGEEGNTDGFPYGGDGVSSNITGSSVTRGGGGGSGSTTGAHNSAVGGAGGGGNGSMAHGSAPGSGTANTGGGGGGGYGISVGASGAGGSGIVIIRYNTTTIS